MRDMFPLIEVFLCFAAAVVYGFYKDAGRAAYWGLAGAITAVATWGIRK